MKSSSQLTQNTDTATAELCSTLTATKQFLYLRVSSIMSGGQLWLTVKSSISINVKAYLPATLSLTPS